MAICSVDQLLADANTNRFTSLSPTAQRQVLLQLLCELSSGGGGGGGSPGGLNTQVQFNNAGAFGGDADFTWNQTTNLLSITGGVAITAEPDKTPFAVSGYSLTGANAQSLMSLAGTWNTTGHPTALRLAITDTASGATANLLELLAGAAGATSMFQVSKTGVVRLANGAAAAPSLVFMSSGTMGFYRSGTGQIAVSDGTSAFAGFGTGSTNGLRMAALTLLGWTTGANITTVDLSLFRDAADVLAQRRTTNAQTFRLYRTFTDASNYERLALQTAAGQMIVAAETAGTGTDDLDLLLTPAGLGVVRATGPLATNTARVKHVKAVVTTYTLDTTTLDEVVVLNSATPFAVTLTDPTTAANLGRSIVFKNKGAGAVTLTSAAGSQIFAAAAVATLILAVGDSVTLVSDQVFWLVN